MDKQEAIDFLKYQLDEIPRLAKLPFDNQEYPLWRRKIRDIIEVAFERDSSEVKDFAECDWQAPITSLRMLASVHKSAYQGNLQRIETVLRGIMQKYEMLGIAERQESQTLGEEIRKHLQGTPEEIAPHIVRVAQEFQFPQGFNCYAKEESYKENQFSKQLTIYRITDSFTPDVTWMHASSEDEPQVIGFITLQSLPYNKTLFIAKTTLNSFDSYLERLSSEFKNLGIEETTRKKTWRWFKEIIGIVKAVKP